YCAAVGLPREEVLRKQVELLGRAETELSRNLAREAQASGRRHSLIRHAVAGGERRLFQVSERALSDGSLVGFAHDRTETEERKIELDRHIEAHAAVLQNLNVGIAILGADMQLDFHNNAYAEIWQLDEDYLASRPHVTDVLETLRSQRRLPEQADFADYKRTWLRRLKTMIEPYEDLMHVPDGTTLRVTASPHPFGGVILTFEDVTDRLTLERSYNTLIAVQQETLNNLYEGVAVFGQDGRLKLSTKAYAEIWGLSEDMLKGEPHVRDLLPLVRHFYEIDDEAWSDISSRAIANTTEPEARSGRHERSDGRVIDWAQVPLPDGASLFTYVDVTDSIRVERALRERAEALETADRLKSEFVANISYELRTPLNAIIGFAQMLEENYAGALNERQSDYARAIVDSSQELTSLINNLLDLASIEAGYLQLERTDAEISELLRSASILLRERMRSQNLKLEVVCPRNIGRLSCDERRLLQALFNLLSNACQFTDEGGKITLGARRGDGEVCFYVEDSGIGIPADDQERVFSSFERGSERRISQRSGAGLGLALVKSLIELHGGWVEMQSAEDQGTTVTCHLPEGELPQQNAELPGRPQAAAG
ncbi:MAG: PAS-domain containing protein, partial [Rhodovibrionaceae bacterium]